MKDTFQHFSNGKKILILLGSFHLPFWTLIVVNILALVCLSITSELYFSLLAQIDGQVEILEKYQTNKSFAS